MWMETSAGNRRVTYDALASYPIAPSPSGDRVAFAVPDGKPVREGQRPSMLVVVIDADGRTLAKFAPGDGYFDGIEWIDSERIGVVMEGHANSIYWVVDANSGEILQKFFGGFDFLWSHDRQHVARRALGSITLQDEKGASFESDDLSSLMFDDDGDRIYPPDDPKTERHYERILGYLTWSPNDAWVSFPES